MYKSKLQEFCQSRKIDMPEYTTMKEGVDQCPRFKAVVSVCGLSFTAPEFCRNSKEAQNQAAKLAFDHLTRSSIGNIALPTAAASSSILQPKSPDSSQNAYFDQSTSMIKDDGKFKSETYDMAHLYKNRLQLYSQRNKLALPVYTSEHEGPPHALRFKSKVTLDGKSYGCPEYFNTVKEAENASAKVALLAVSPGGLEEDDIGFSKNLLQMFLQREYSCLPKYATSQSGASHVAVFVSTVEINGETFKGDEAKTKKQAEANAAKVAYAALKERGQGLDVHSIQPDIKRPLHLPGNNKGGQGLDVHSIQPDIKRPLHLPGNNKGGQGLDVHSIQPDIKRPLHLPGNNKGGQGLDVHSIQPAIKRPLYLPGNNKVAHEDAAKSMFVMKVPEVFTGEKHKRSLQNLSSLADTLFEEDLSAVAASEVAKAPVDSAKKATAGPPPASVSPPQVRRIQVTRPFVSGMKLPPGAILRHCDGKSISYEVPTDE